MFGLLGTYFEYQKEMEDILKDSWLEYNSKKRELYLYISIKKEDKFIRILIDDFKCCLSDDEKNLKTDEMCKLFINKKDKEILNVSSKKKYVETSYNKYIDHLLLINDFGYSKDFGIGFIGLMRMNSYGTVDEIMDKVSIGYVSPEMDDLIKEEDKEIHEKFMNFLSTGNYNIQYRVI